MIMLLYYLGRAAVMDDEAFFDTSRGYIPENPRDDSTFYSIYCFVGRARCYFSHLSSLTTANTGWAACMKTGIRNNSHKRAEARIFFLSYGTLFLKYVRIYVKIGVARVFFYIFLNVFRSHKRV